MTIMMHFHQSQYRDFKAYYTDHVRKQLRAEFPELVCYARFVARRYWVLWWLTCEVYTEVAKTFLLLLQHLWHQFRPHSLPKLISEWAMFMEVN